MWLCNGVAFQLPAGPRLWDGLIGPGFVFIELHDPIGFRLLAGQLNQPFFSSVSRS